nr:hypothetical protein [Paracoccaceae bacterium]
AYGNGQMLAGGGGADVLRVERQGTTGPAILWGGEGADEFRLAEDFVFNTDGEVELRMPAGILLATVTGLTELNFHLFDLAMLGLPQDFDWSQIDAVILNPDPEDRLFLGDEQQSVVMGSYQVGYDPASTLDYLRVVSGDYEDGGRVVDFFTAGFLGSGEYTVFAAGAEVWETGLYDYVNPAHAAYVESAHPDWDWWRGYLEEEFYLGEGMDFSIEAPTREYVDITYGARTQENAPPDGESVTYDLDGETYLHHVGVQSLDDVGTFMTTQHIGPWFFLGGQLDRAALAADATFTADMSGYFEELWL